MANQPRLNQRVTVQQLSGSVDSYGHTSPLTWTDVAPECWARVTQLGGTERLKALAIDADITHRVRVRYQPALHATVASIGWRIVYGSRILAVTGSHDVDEARTWIEFDCKEGLTNG